MTPEQLYDALWLMRSGAATLYGSSMALHSGRPEGESALVFGYLKTLEDWLAIGDTQKAYTALCLAVGKMVDGKVVKLEAMPWIDIALPENVVPIR